MGNDSEAGRCSELSTSVQPELSRRQFIQWSSLAIGWRAASHAARPPSVVGNFPGGSESPPAAAKKVTLLEDGGFHHHGRGWQLGPGCEIISAKGAPSPEVLHVKGHGSTTARATILSPESGKTYTVHGYMRT